MERNRARTFDRLIFLWLAASLLCRSLEASGGPRRPRDLVPDPEGRLLYVANEASGTVSVVDLVGGRVVSETELDPQGRPRAIALLPRAGGGTLVAVAETYRHRVRFLETPAGPPGHAGKLALVGAVEVGRLPEDLAALETGAFLVACEGENEVWLADPKRAGTERGAVTDRFPAVEGVRRIAPIPESQARFALAGRTEVAVLDLAERRILWSAELSGGRALNLNALAADARRIYVAHQIRPTEVAIDPQMVVWGLVIANRLTVYLHEDGRPAPSAPPRELPLDGRPRAAGDPEGIAVLPGESDRPAVVVTSGGTGRILRVGIEPEQPADGPLERYDPTPEAYLGARPTAIALSRDGRRLYVALTLEDRVVELDASNLARLRTFALAEPRRPTPAELGERIFYDARRSRGGWYSCHSCHPDGGTRGHLFDTSADGDGLAKKAPDVRATVDTGPWAWRGRFKTLEAQAAASLERTMGAHRPPEPEDVERVVQFLSGLRLPAPARTGEDLGGDPARGRAVFRKARCAKCHRPPAYTSPGLHDVGVFDGYDGVRRYNAPSLRGVRDRFRWLHDARARSLEDVFRRYDPEGRHGRTRDLSEAEFRDLLAFLKTL